MFIHINIVNFPWEELPAASGGGGGQQYPTDQSAVEQGTTGFSKNPLQRKDQTLKNPTAYVCTAPRCTPAHSASHCPPAVMLGADRGMGDSTAALPGDPGGGAVAPHGRSGALGYGCRTTPSKACTARHGPRLTGFSLQHGPQSLSRTCANSQLPLAPRDGSRVKPRLSTSLLSPALAPP